MKLFAICGVSIYGLALLGGAFSLRAGDLPPKNAGSSSVDFTMDKDGTRWAHIHNQSYDAIDGVYLEDDPGNKSHCVLIQENLEKDVPLYTDSPPITHLKLVAWIGQDGFPQKPLWTVKTEGDSYQLGNDFVEVTHDGFGDEFTSYSYFRLTDGQKVCASDTPLLTVNTSEAGPVLHFTYREQFEDKEIPDALVANKIRGIVTISDKMGVVARLGIFGHPDDDKPDQPYAWLKQGSDREENRELTLSGNAKGLDAYSHFSVVIFIQPGGEVEIPIEKGVPQLEQAKVPKGYHLEKL